MQYKKDNPKYEISSSICEGTYIDLSNTSLGYVSFECIKL